MAAFSAPDAAETALLHAACRLGPDARPVDEVEGVTVQGTTVSSTQLLQRDHRNCHGFIFGGYLMRKAFEQAREEEDLRKKTREDEGRRGKKQMEEEGRRRGWRWHRQCSRQGGDR